MNRLVIIAVLLAPNAAYAQPAGAVSLRDEGIAAIRANRVDEGCKKVYASLDLWREPSTLSWAAACKGIDRKFATAADYYREVIATTSDVRTKTQAEIALSKLASKISYLIINIPAPPLTGLVITRDGQALAAGSLGVAIPVDDGDTVIAAAAPGRNPASQTIKVSDGKTIHVTIPELSLVPAGPVIRKEPVEGVEGTPDNIKPPIETANPPHQADRTQVAKLDNEIHAAASLTPLEPVPASKVSYEAGATVGFYDAPADFSTKPNLAVGIGGAIGYRVAPVLALVGVMNADLMIRSATFGRIFVGAGAATTLHNVTLRLAPGIVVLTGLDPTLFGLGMDAAATYRITDSVAVVLAANYARTSESADLMTLSVLRVAVGLALCSPVSRSKRPPRLMTSVRSASASRVEKVK